VRIISATNADIKLAIAKGDFREDLYYRLNVIELPLLPLNQRKSDILPLAEFFLGDNFQLTETAAQVLKHYAWPGNIRELKNVMQRASLLTAEKLIDETVLGLEVELPESFTHKNDQLTAADISLAISQASGVISEAAKLLGLSRSALYRRMKKFEIDG
jgi:DNA-binding NtrC family response regulator